MQCSHPSIVISSQPDIRTHLLQDKIYISKALSGFTGNYSSSFDPVDYQEPALCKTFEKDRETTGMAEDPNAFVHRMPLKLQIFRPCR